MGSLIASLETTLFTGNHLGSLLEVPKAKLSPSLMASKSLSSVASSINDLECGVVGDGLCGIEEDDWGMVSVGLWGFKCSRSGLSVNGLKVLDCRKGSCNDS